MASESKESNMVVLPTEKQAMSVSSDGSVVVVTESDLAGYDAEPLNVGGGDASCVIVLPELSLACKLQFTFARISFTFPRRQVLVDQLQSLGVNIKVCYVSEPDK